MKWIEEELSSLADLSLLRTLRESAPVPNRPSYTMRNGHVLLNLASNDYLGLAQHPVIIESMREKLLIDGAGSGASRLVTGNGEQYARLEEALAAWQNSEASLVFANGYMANSSVISALVGRGDVVFSDQLNHASIVDGVVLSRAEHARYRHNDMEHLKVLLRKHRNKRRKLIVTDAVFSMDGDHAHLRELVSLKNEFGAMLMVDEAHSGGMFGSCGEGLCHELGLQNEVDVHMGTFSKAFGVYGAYVCGSRNLIRWLINKARALIYSTALPPSLIAGILTALTFVQTEHWRRKRLRSSSWLFRSSLSEAGFHIADGDTPIIPLIVGDNAAALRFSALLEQEGIAAVAIRPPSVPSGTARIRFSLSAAHTEQELIEATRCIRRIGYQLGVLRA
ncbi:8-amino-7-oxononanoate synthase [Bacillus sp. FJAT-26390]|uniref:8-amino-7-oxononanoate synthase n=1 Tax=Bacillus sp. FJAT-26390 TaxID=1743142 RepID=UPI000807A2EF|nr:8-amino-7-oxononanoate synthase [Bacillus sp. FJAT-26390]OBZ16727.1 8-amino-7-oxononanoate synthase [Bacillus sp. FJAT-26390]